MSGIGLRIKAVRAERKVSQEWVAERVGIRYQTIQDLENGSSRGSKHLLKIARVLAVTPHWLETGDGPKDVRELSPANFRETLTSPSSLPNDGPAVMLRVLGMGEGGTDGWNLWNGDVIEEIKMPDNLVGVSGAYAVYVTGKSMEPRYHPGERVHIHPGKPALPGCYVLVQRKPKADGEPPLAVIKQLVRRSGSKVVLAQLNPPKQFDVPVGDIVSIHRIVGSSEP